jgi:hypothetical protein
MKTTQTSCNTECKTYAILLPVGLGIAMALLSGCSVDRIEVGWPATIREFGQSRNGMVEQVKASPDRETAYWQTQKMQASKGMPLPGE